MKAKLLYPVLFICCIRENKLSEELSEEAKKQIAKNDNYMLEVEKRQEIARNEIYERIAKYEIETKLQLEKEKEEINKVYEAKKEYHHKN